MKLLVVACLIAVCYAQPPPARIPEEFTTLMETTFKVGKHETKGKGMWGRNVELKEFVERVEIMAPEGKPTEFHEMLGLFEKEVIYSIEAEMVNGTRHEHCEPRKLDPDEQFRDVWAWVYDSKTKEETKTINGTTYIIYTARGHHDNDIRELAVNAATPTVPVLEMYNSTAHVEIRRYMDFKPTPPDSKEFEVPTSCHTPPRRN